MTPSPLHQALLKSDVESAEVYLTNPSAPTWCQETYHGYTPLAIACRRSDGPITDELILKILSTCPRAAAIPTKSSVGDYPVHVCAKHGSVSATVIEALLLEYPYAVEHKSQTSIGILMTPQQLARGNKNLSESAKLALQQPLDHWISLKNYTKYSSNHEGRLCEDAAAKCGGDTRRSQRSSIHSRTSETTHRTSVRSSITSRCDGESRFSYKSAGHRDSSQSEARTALLSEELHRVQDKLNESKNTEAILLSKLNALESKMEKLVLVAERATRRGSAAFNSFVEKSTRRLSATGAVMRRRSIEHIVDAGKQARHDGVSNNATQRRASIKAQRRGSSSVNQEPSLGRRGSITTKQNRRGSALGRIFNRAKEEYKTNETARDKIKKGAVATGGFIVENFFE